MNYLKNALILLLLILSSFSSIAKGALSIEKGDVLINPSLTLGGYDYGYSWDIVNVIPPVAFNFEYASTNYLSFGLEAEYGLRRYKDNLFTASDYLYKYEYKTIGFRGSFHYLDFFKNMLADKLGGFNSENLDFYVGASTGLLWINTTEKWDQEGMSVQHERKTFDSNWRFGYFAGFRYYFSNRFGAFLETGKNPLGWVKVGLTLKL
ncbi:MAG: hypothetical protein GQ574_09090 [Crocinitomix sp.]|nr:hypothetical protein [Crocinitomix sp.]